MPEKLADRFLSEIKRAIGEGKVITCVYSLSALNLKGSANLEVLPANSGLRPIFHP
jgi:hypothetical protein